AWAARSARRPAVPRNGPPGPPEPKKGPMASAPPPPPPAEERMHGHAFELAAQVPQGDIEPADGVNHGPGAPEIVERALEPQRQTSIGRVLAERERRDPMVERRNGCLPTAAESFAPADDAAVGRDAHHDRIDRGARP